MIEFKGNVNFQKVLWRNERSVLFSFKTQGDKGFYCNAFCDSVFHDKLLSSDEIAIHGTLGNSKVKDSFREGKNGEKYDFQIFSFKDGKSFESNEQLFERINELYKRALKQRLNIVDEAKLRKSFVIDENKFSLNKLKYTVAELERFSFVDGKNSFNGKDILGDFFEGIIREGFKQTKGQFFTHINIVKFLLWGLQLDKLAIERVNNDLEIPYLIDPSRK